MVIALCVFSFAVLLPLIAKEHKKLAISVSFVALFVFLAIRCDFGNDYQNYERIHWIIQNKGMMSRWLTYSGCEAYSFLNFLFKDFYVMIAFISFLYCYIVYRLITNNCDKRYWALSIFILTFNPYILLVQASSLRQTMAILVFIVAVDFAYKKNIIAYFCLIYLASLFHSSAVVLYPVYFLLCFDWKESFVLAVIMCALMVILSGSAVTSFVGDVSGSVIGQGKTENYMVGENSVRATILSSLYLLFMLFAYPEAEEKDAIYLRLGIVSALCAVVALRVAMFTRIQMYFEIFTIVAIPVAFKSIKAPKFFLLSNELYRFLWIALLIIIYFLRVYSFFTNPTWESFVEYQTIFQR